MQVLCPSYCAIIHNDSANAYLYLPGNHVTIIQYISIVNNAYFCAEGPPTGQCSYLYANHTINVVNMPPD
jgi:hypothetical protein